MTEYFTIGNGARQGGVLSPSLCNRYVKDVITKLRSNPHGCNVAGFIANVLAYAGDFVLCAPTWKGLQHLINDLADSITEINMTCNVKKTVCMIFSPKDRSKRINTVFNNFQFGDDNLAFVASFKYLGHINANDLKDDLDIGREIRNLFVRTNVLKCIFMRCSIAVKVILFKFYCICLYGNYNIENPIIKHLIYKLHNI